MSAPATAKGWLDVCALDDILPQAGVCALVHGVQVAIFRTGDGVFALDNADPKGRANVLARGIVGDLDGQLVVASPLYKHHYNLATGRCLEDDAIAVATHRVRVRDGRVEVASRHLRPVPPVRPPGRPRLVLVGNGPAGMRALEELLAIAPGRYDITVFGAEPRGGYNRVALSGLLSGEKTWEDVAGHDRAWFEQRAITLFAGDPVVEIDRARRLVRSRSGRQCGYDRLLLATGSRPLELDVPGRDLAGVLAFRSLDDVEAMLQRAARGGRAVVVGGGLLGIEAASGLHARGLHVTLVHRGARLLNRQLDSEAAGLLEAALRQRGLDVLLGAGTRELVGERQVRAVRLGDGRELAADLVVTAIGIRPDVDLARRAGIHCDRGILVDDTMQTFDPRVWAIGECVQHRRRTFGLVAPLWEQARVCALHLAERGTARYRAPVAAAHLDVNGLRVFSAGDVAGGAGADSIVLRDPMRGVYKRLVLREGRLAGAVLFGDTADASWYCDLLRDGRDVSAMRDALLFGRAEAAS